MRSRKLSMAFVLIGAALAVVLGLFLLDARRVRTRSTTPSKPTTHGTPRFFLMFPVEGATLKGSANEHEDAKLSLQRAILVGREEARSPRIGVWVGDEEYWIAREELCLIPSPPAKWDVLVGNLRTEIRSWGSDSDWSDIEARLVKSPGSESLVELELTMTEGGSIVIRYYANATGPELVSSKAHR